MPDLADIDEILLIQLTVARLGEKEMLNWWNTDIAYKLGGSDFLSRLVGSAFAPLAAGEAILLAARLKEEPLVTATRSNAVFSLFLPEPALRIALAQRYRHFKTYPGDLPEAFRLLLDPATDFKPAELLARLEVAPPEFQGTTFGREIEVRPEWSAVQTSRALASTLKAADKGRYVMPYYRGDDAD